MAIGKASGGFKAVKDLFKKHDNGIIKSTKAGGAERLAQGWSLGEDGAAVKGAGFLNKIKRNPKTTLAIGAAALIGMNMLSNQSQAQPAQ